MAVGHLLALWLQMTLTLGFAFNTSCLEPPMNSRISMADIRCVPAARASLMDLPQDALIAIVRHLEVQDVCSLSMASKLCRATCREASPGLHLSLYPHQVRGAVHPAPLHLSKYSIYGMHGC